MNEPLALGIDIGGTNTAYGFVNRRGEIISKGSISTLGHENPAAYMKALGAALLPEIERYEKEKIERIFL